ncbi:hypothetical protein ACWDWS_37680 [Streptomyces sp. NPDC003328]
MIAMMPLVSVAVGISGRVVETAGPHRVLLGGLVCFSAGLGLVAAVHADSYRALEDDHHYLSLEQI